MFSSNMITHNIKEAGNKIKTAALACDVFWEASATQNHPRNGSTLRHVRSILSVNDGVYIFTKKQEVREFLPGYGQDTRYR